MTATEGDLFDVYVTDTDAQSYAQQVVSVEEKKMKYMYLQAAEGC